MHSSGASRRGVVKSCLELEQRHCEERLVRRSSTSEGGSDEAIHSFFARQDGLLRGACHRARIRATRWLAMTVSKLLVFWLFEIESRTCAGGGALPLPLWERVGVRGRGLSMERNPSPG